MKKAISVLLGLFLMFGAFGCGGKSGNPSGSGGENNPPVPPVTEKEYEVTEVSPKVWADGIYTVSQSSGSYQANLALPSDTMMVFGRGYDSVASQIKDWVNNKGYKQIDIFLPIGRDHDSHYIDGGYDGQKHYDIVQTFKNGTKNSHPSGRTYYTFPSEGFAVFLADYAKRALNAGAKDVYLEEPDGFSNAVYCDYFKNKWQEVYGEDFIDPDTSAEARYKSDKLIAKICTDAMKIFAKEVKKDYPNTKIYIATHSSLSYASNPISADNYGMVSADGIDGIIAQAWTNTTTQTIVYDKENATLPFEVGYSEYSELKSIASATGKKYYSLSDPAADGAFTFEFTRGVYEQNVVSQLLQPDINSFQISIWPDRSFGNASDTYKRMQQGVFAAMNEVRDEKAVRKSGTTGVALLMSYNAVSNANAADVRSYVLSVTAPLLEQGIPVEVVLIESLSADVLKNYHTIIASYNYIKPEDAGVNTLLSNFVKGGGSLVWLGAEDNFSELEGFWGANSSPRAHLFRKMNIVQSENYYKEPLNILKQSDAPEWFSDFTTEFDVDIASVSSQSGTVYLKSGERNFLVGESCEKGNVLRLGIDTNNLLDSKDLRKLLTDTVHFGIALAGKKYLTPGYILTERGLYTAIKTYDKEVALDGTYMNIFDDEMKIVSNPVVEKNSYGLYKKLPQDGVARVFYANCADVDCEEVNNVFGFNTKVIYQSETVVLVSLPYVDYSTVNIKDSVSGEGIACNPEFDEETRMLKLVYVQSTRNPIKVEIVLE